MSILRSTYGSLWNSCEGCSCRARECWRVVIQVLKAGNERRSFSLRSGMLFTFRFEPGSVNVDILAVFAVACVMLVVGRCVGMGCVDLRYRAARRMEFINSGQIILSCQLSWFMCETWLGVLDTARSGRVNHCFQGCFDDVVQS